MKPWGMINLTGGKNPIVLGIKRSKVKVTWGVAAITCFSLYLFLTMPTIFIVTAFFTRHSLV